MAPFGQAGLTIWIAVLAGGCSPDSVVSVDSGLAADAGWDTKCGLNLKPHGPACVPILDDCPDDHVPVPGGGCKRVGVKACGIDGVPGIAGPPDWTCVRIGVAECTTAEGALGIRGPPDWTCKPVGPGPQCLLGWALTSDGWCEPILPKTACPSGTMEVIGKTDCQPVGDCGTGKWGKIKVTPATVFVDGAYTGKSDGSATKPHRTIAQGLAAAGENGHVAVAAGTYKESVAVVNAVVLEGRCPELVRIKGGATRATATVEIKGVAKPVTLRGLSISGPHVGVRVSDGSNVVLEQVVVRGTGGVGVASSKAHVTVRDSLVRGAATHGMLLEDTAATLERISVRETRSRPSDGQHGNGIVVNSIDRKTTLTLRGSVLRENRNVGLFVLGANALVERTAVVQTKGRSLDDLYGNGVVVGPNRLSLETGTPGDVGSNAVLRDCLVADNRVNGFGLSCSKATLQRTVVRDTQPRKPDGQGGIGIMAYCIGPPRPELTVVDSVVARNRTHGILLYGTVATLQRTIVSHTLPLPSDQSLGDGIVSVPADPQTPSPPSELTVERSVVGDNERMGIFSADGAVTLRDSLVVRNQRSGVELEGTTALVERTRIADSGGKMDPGPFTPCGLGLASYMSDDKQSTLTVRDSSLTDTKGMGILVGGLSQAGLKRVLVRGTRPCDKEACVSSGVYSGPYEAKAPTELSLEDCTLTDNAFTALHIVATPATVKRTVVKDTRSHFCDDYDVEFGSGILAMGPQGDLEPVPLLIQDTVVAGNRTAGIALYDDVTATVERVGVRDSQPNSGDEFGGAGLFAGSYDHRCELALKDVRVSVSRKSGIELASARARLERVVVSDTREGKANALDGSFQDGFGDGIVVYQSPAADPTFLGSLDLSDSLVQGSARAGLLFRASGGSVRRSVLRQGIVAVVLDEGADPAIADDNVFEGNLDNRIGFGQNLPVSKPLKLPPVAHH